MASGLIPPPPPNQILADRIIKIAVNVVTNGQNFEAFVKQKEANNPDFEFLRGGLYSEYYEYVKQTEAAKLAAQRAGGMVQAEPQGIDVEKLRAQIVALKKQVAESEFNVDQQKLVHQKIDEVR
uniref:SURP motif domain-containing protein n=1 Tax=Panagrolaimus sp. JU765 TaxID=591449 RepID=A0AC34RKU8_9BILA